MNSNSQDKSKLSNNRIRSMIQSISKFKVDFITEREECLKLQGLNSKLEVEIKEVREIEKSHRHHLQCSREMIGNLQDTVSKLIYIKREMKKIKEDSLSKDARISTFEKDKQSTLEKFDESIKELRKVHEKEISELVAFNERKIQQIQQESEMQSTLYGCTVEEIKMKLKETESQHTEKMNMVVLEYEEKIQRASAQIAQLQEQITRQAARANSDTDAYRRRLEELEEKQKKSQIKEYLAQSSYPSQYQVERPYSVNKNPYRGECSTIATDPVLDSNKSGAIFTQNKALRAGRLQVMYTGSTTPAANDTDNKGQFSIKRKRRLYNDKDFQDF